MRKRLWITVFVLIMLPLIAAVIVLGVLRASLATLDGERVTGGLTSPVTIERDARGTVTIIADTRIDAAFAAGFVHAQERWFQMDLQRRASAGELSALFGVAALEYDKRQRLHAFRRRAEAMLASMPAEPKALYLAYADGVNRGLEELGARPFEYFLLRQQPQPWQPEDSLLTVFNMWFELNDERARRESQLGLLRDLLPPAVYAWLIQSGTDWDAPLTGNIIAPVPLPPAGVYDLRGTPASLGRPMTGERQSPGSNNWAVAGAHTRTGAALVAGDMHLGHRVPNIWFRGRIVVAKDELDINGVMLSGTPFVIAGSNGHIAWSFTNSYGDWEDLVVLEIDPQDPGRYRAPAGWTAFEQRLERIDVAGQAAQEVTYEDTIWGPVLDRDWRGRKRVLHWLAHYPQATNDELMRLEQARDVAAALDTANRIGAPPQNIVVGDRHGRIGWTIMGQIPMRQDIDPLRPQTWSASQGWNGWLPVARYPRITDPAAGVLWTANARVVSGPWLDLVGEGNYPPGARAKQIRDALLGRNDLDAADMLAIQLDDRALFLQRWQTLLLQVLDDAATADNPRRRELRELVSNWGGHASIDSAGYRIVRAFRNETHEAVLAGLLAPVAFQVPGFVLDRHSQLERPVWQLLQQRPAHLLNPAYDSWQSLLLTQVDELIAQYQRHDGSLTDRTWGEFNTSRIAHPLSQSLPALSGWLDMPAVPLPGDSNMPRVQGPAFGASQRMAVSPGYESEGYLHMPGGQSGHPLSPFYGAGHDDWVHGIATPFLPGETRHRLVLRP
ncbi:MAG: penicillin acylase family protein [Gammaproteobacteria bacterium]|nr:penicillin acylase family protein [Gammaproteobacteria bacterium]